MSDKPGGPAAVSELLRAWGRGEKEAEQRLMPLLYDELRALANMYLRRERPGHTLRPTALVNEAYLRLASQAPVGWTGKAHFMAVAAKVMRHVLVDHARRRGAAKRAGSWCRVSLDEAVAADLPRELDFIALDRALAELAELDPDQARLVELRFFGGLEVEEVAEIMGVSATTLKRSWRAARAWLFQRLAGA